MTIAAEREDKRPIMPSGCKVGAGGGAWSVERGKTKGGGPADLSGARGAVVGAGLRAFESFLR